MHESKSMKKTKTLVGMAIFTALVVVLQLMSGVIKIGMFSPSLVLIPIVIGAAVYGAAAGAWLGLVFGVVVFICCVTGADPGGNAMFVFNPMVTALICLGKVRQPAGWQPWCSVPCSTRTRSWQQLWQPSSARLSTPVCSVWALWQCSSPCFWAGQLHLAMRKRS